MAGWPSCWESLCCYILSSVGETMSDFERILRLMGGAATAQRKFIDAFHAGADSARNGPNVENTHYSWFATPESKKEWEHGRSSVNG